MSMKKCQKTKGEITLFSRNIKHWWILISQGNTPPKYMEDIFLIHFHVFDLLSRWRLFHKTHILNFNFIRNIYLCKTYVYLCKTFRRKKNLTKKYVSNYTYNITLRWILLLRLVYKYFPGSKPTRCSAGLRDPTSLRGSRWPSGQKCESAVINIGRVRLPLKNGPKSVFVQPNGNLKNMYFYMHFKVISPWSYMQHGYIRDSEHFCTKNRMVLSNTGNLLQWDIKSTQMKIHNAKILKLKLKLINFLFYYLNSTRITIFAKTNMGLGTWWNGKQQRKDFVITYM